MLLPYKDDNPTSTFPVVTVSIIVANVLIYLFFRFKAGFNDDIYYGAVWSLGLRPREFFSRRLIFGWEGVPTPLKLITSMFMHGGFLHLAGNMLYLWIFGNNIEDYLGHLKFLGFYLLAGLCGSLIFLITQPTSTAPMVGASGAIAGVLGAYFILYPRAKVHVLLFLFIFITTFTLPAVIVLGFWIALQIWEGIGDFGRAGSGIAWFAHIGGFFAGIALLKLIPRRKRALKSPSFYLQ